jgi:hypothetical protein
MRKLYKSKWTYLFLLLITVVTLVWCYHKESRLSDYERTPFFEPVPSINGSIEVWFDTVHDGEHGKPVIDYSALIINLNDGQIAVRDSLVPQKGSPSEASIYRCEGMFYSPDKKLNFSCKPVSGLWGDTPISFRIADERGKEVLAAQLDEGSWIKAIDWSPDSSAIAVLVEKERYGKCPLEILSAFSGHPVPYESFGLRVYSLKSSAQLSVPSIVKEIPYGSALVRWKSASGDAMER